jgi:hypothetical protein
MKEYLTIFSLGAFTLGILIYTTMLSLGRGSFADYRSSLTILLSFVSLISNAAISYYFTRKPSGGRRQP